MLLLLRLMFNSLRNAVWQLRHVRSDQEGDSEVSMLQLRLAVAFGAPQFRNRSCVMTTMAFTGLHENH